MEKSFVSTLQPAISYHPPVSSKVHFPSSSDSSRASSKNAYKHVIVVVVIGRDTFKAPAIGESKANLPPLQIDPTSQRLQLLSPFSQWSGKELTDMLVLIKVRGKCTTDHISAGI